MWKSDPYNYHRRPTDEVKIGTLKMGGAIPVRVQSMANTNTNDIDNQQVSINISLSTSDTSISCGIKQIYNINS